MAQTKFFLFFYKFFFCFQTIFYLLLLFVHSVLFSMGRDQFFVFLYLFIHLNVFSGRLFFKNLAKPFQERFYPNPLFIWKCQTMKHHSVSYFKKQFGLFFFLFFFFLNIYTDKQTEKEKKFKTYSRTILQHLWVVGHFLPSFLLYFWLF